MFRNLVEGALLVSLVLYLFLSNMRASLAVVVVIPLALLSTFLGLKIMGVPANLLSLGAMDFGIIVDGAVIVIENIMHRLAEKGKAGEDMGDDERREVIADAVNEVGRPTLFSMLIIIAAHIPIFALQRHEGRIFQPMALSVTTALIGSLIFSLTLVPLLAYWMLRKKLPHGDNRVVLSAKRLYQPVLDWSLSHRRSVVVIALAVFGLAMVAAARLGSEFLPELNEGTIWVNLRLPASVSNDEAARVLRTVRKALLAVPEVRTVVSKAGQPEDGTDPKTISMAEVFVDLKPVEQWRKGLTKEQAIEEMDRAVSAVPGMQPSFSQPIRDNVLESISQIDGQIVIKVSGDDLAELRKITESVEREIKQVPGVFRAEIDRQGALPLQNSFNSGPFDEGSIFFKAIVSTLDDAQKAKYEKTLADKRLFRYRAKIDLTVAFLDNAVGFKADQRKQLAELLLAETKPPRRYGQYDYYVVMWQASHLPEAKLKPLFDDTQWKLLNRQFTQVKGMEPFLKQNGYLEELAGDAAKDEAGNKGKAVIEKKAVIE